MDRSAQLRAMMKSSSSHGKEKAKLLKQMKEKEQKAQQPLSENHGTSVRIASSNVPAVTQKTPAIKEERLLNISSSSGLPAGFFDEEPQTMTANNSGSKLATTTAAIPASSTSATMTTTANGFPAGFFDDPNEERKVLSSAKDNSKSATNDANSMEQNAPLQQFFGEINSIENNVNENGSIDDDFGVDAVEVKEYDDRDEALIEEALHRAYQAKVGTLLHNAATVKRGGSQKSVEDNNGASRNEIDRKEIDNQNVDEFHSSHQHQAEEVQRVREEAETLTSAISNAEANHLESLVHSVFKQKTREAKRKQRDEDEANLDGNDSNSKEMAFDDFFEIDWTARSM